MWLKAFDRAEVDSCFYQDGKLYRRTFSFTAMHGVRAEPSVEVYEQTIQTTLKLEGFDKENYASCCKSTLSIAEALLEHCLWYFVRSPAMPNPNIVVGMEVKAFHSTVIYDRCMHSAAKPETVCLKGNSFEPTHIKFRARVNKAHSMFLCAANRVVKEELISKKVPGLFGVISDDADEFTYACYATSSYLDNHVRSERTAFNIVESSEGLTSDIDISLSEIREAVIDRTKEYLSGYLHENMKAGRERVDSFVAQKAPRYRSIMNHIDEHDLVVNPRISDKELEHHLHKQCYEAEKALLDEGHEVMNPTVENDLEDYLKI